MEHQLVVFNLSNEDYGVDIAAVDGIVKMQTITSVPHAPDFVEGITNLRGEILPVIDLRKRFGLPVEEVTKDTRIVNVNVGNVKIGMIVDAVSQVLRVSEENIEPPSPIVMADADAASGGRNAFITGIAKVDDGPDTPGRLIILLDLVKVLSAEEQTELQALQAQDGTPPAKK